MRPHGRASIDPSNPRALGVCDNCGFLFNLKDLAWNMAWRGPTLQNTRFLVCDSCQDVPNPNGQRTFILPQDPVPVKNPRPEFYVPNDNPLSGIGVSANFLHPQYGNRIGTMIYGGGLNAPFDGNPNKSQQLSAAAFTPMSSYQNYVGINWTGNQNLTLLSSLKSPVLTHTLSSYTVVAPNDNTFGSTSIVIQGSPTGGGWGAWTTLATETPAGTVGETITGTPTVGGAFQFHRAAFYGGTGQVSVALVSFSVAEVSSI